MRVSPESLHTANPKGFIVLEGVNGAGKSTLQRRLVEYLRSRGREVVSTFEPGGTPLGAELRKILLEGSAGKVSAVAELFLFCADRREHVERVIAPALHKGSLVVCDRYFYSTTAFQGYGRGLPLDAVLSLHPLAVDDLYPDLVLLLDLDPETGLRRNSAGKGLGKDSFEQEQLAFHTRLRTGFLELAADRPEPFVVLDAARSESEVFEAARAAVDKLFSWT